MGVIRFYGRVIKVAVSHSLDQAQAVVFAIFVAGGVVSYIFPWITVNAGIWGLAAFVLALIILIRLGLAPYWVWKEEHKRAGGLTLGCPPHALVVSGQEVRPVANSGLRIVARLNIENTSDTPVQIHQSAGFLIFNKEPARAIGIGPGVVRRFSMIWYDFPFQHRETLIVPGVVELYVEIIYGAVERPKSRALKIKGIIRYNSDVRSENPGELNPERQCSEDIDVKIT